MRQPAQHPHHLALAWRQPVFAAQPPIGDERDGDKDEQRRGEVVQPIHRAHVDGRLRRQQALQVLPTAGRDQEHHRRRGQPVQPDGALREPSNGAVGRPAVGAERCAARLPEARDDAEPDGEWQCPGEDEIVAEELAPRLSAELHSKKLTAKPATSKTTPSASRMVRFIALTLWSGAARLRTFAACAACSRSAGPAPWADPGTCARTPA